MRILKKKYSNVLDVYYLSYITTRTSNLKNTVLVLIDLQSNPPKRPQSAANDVEGVGFTMCEFTSHNFSRVTSILHDAWLTTEFLSPSV